LKGVSETGGFEQPHARMVDRAMVPSIPVAPNKQRTILLALILGGPLGCGIAILLARLDNAIRTPEDVTDRLNVPLLGTLPLMEGKDTDDVEDQMQASWGKAGSGFSEAMRTIRTGIVLSNLDDPAKVIVVTSSVPGEGKSTAALHIAQAFGQMERTVLIDADMRRPSLARRLDMDKNTRGLSQLVAGTATLDDCLAPQSDRGLDVLSSGLIPPNPLEMLSSAKFIQVLEALKARYDRVVIDSAPVGMVSDGLVLASYADSVIFVVKAETTPASVAQRNLNNIIASNEPLTGVVLNMFDPKAAAAYGGRRYGGGYKYGYGGYGRYGRYGYATYTSSEYTSHSPDEKS
jgi:capsular exopolysaccharide synthesis family protein